jgi:ribose transport system substrate-binding protein
MKSRIISTVVMVFLVVVMVLAGISCKASTVEETTAAAAETTAAAAETTVAAETTAAAETAAAFEDLTALDLLKASGATKISEDLDIPRTKDIAFDPNGNLGVNYKDIVLTAEEQMKLKEKADSGTPFTAILAWHMVASQFNTLQRQSTKDILEKFGVKVIGESDAGWDAEKHIANLQTHIEQKPDLIVSIPVSEKPEAEIYTKMAEAGIKSITIDLFPFGLTSNQVQGFVTTNERGNGYTAGEYLGNLLGGAGNVATEKLAFYHYCTLERVIGATEALTTQFPDIKIVEAAETPGSDISYQDVADSIIAKHPDLNGVFAFYDYPALSVAIAAKNAGLDPAKFHITTTDLNEISAIEMLSEGYIKEISASDPYAMGVTAAILGLKALLGEPGAPFVSVQGFAITKDNVIDAFETFNRQAASDEMKALSGK